MNFSTPPFNHKLVSFLLLAVSLLLMLLIVSAAQAQNDTFLLGNGQDGAYTAPGGTTSLNTVAPVSGAVTAGASSLTVGTSRPGAVAFAANHLVLIHQTTGYAGTVTAGDQSAINLTNGPVGRWEYARLASVSGSTLNFSAPLVNTYSNASAQVIAVPEYTTVTVASGRTLTAQAWDGSSGGFLAFLATGAVTNNGAVTASSKGFRGGALVNHTVTYACSDLDGNLKNAQKGEGIYPAGYGASQVARGNKTNGGGGGNCHNAGGAGGGNAGVGGNGSIDWGGNDYHSIGGSPLTYSPYTVAVFGGGGGAGEENDNLGTTGGVGGGVVVARAASMSGSGTVSAAGATAATAGNDGPGGGGAGGVVVLRFSGAATCSVNVSGGDGGGSATGHGPGGGGAGGVALVQGSSSGTCPANTSNGVAGVAGTSGNRGAGPAVLNAAGYTGTSTTNSNSFVALSSAVTSPGSGSYTNSSTPTYSGTATANATVSVYLDGTLIGTATADGSGNWSYTSIVAVTAGAHTVYVIPSYQGTSGAQSNSRGFTVDLTAPAAPVITTPSANVVTTNLQPTIAGTAEANSTITIYDGATSSGSVSANGSGGWTYSPGSALADGAHAFTVKATDAAGNVSVASGARTITVDTVPPVVTVSTPTTGQAVNDSTPDIVFSVSETNLGATTCSVDGGASTSCSSPFTTGTLSEGAHSVSVRHVDAAGNTATIARSFDVDTTNPSVTISSPTSGQATGDNTPNIVFAVTDSHPGTTACAVDGGTFASCSSPFTTAVLLDGSHSASVRHTDTAGNVTTTARSFSVDTVAPAAPAITDPATDLVTSFTTGTVGGTAEPNSTITLYSGGFPFVTVSADSAGNWSFYTGDPSPEATYLITATATDAAGNVSALSSTRTVAVDTTAPVIAIGSPTASQFVSTASTSVTFSVTESHPGSTDCSVDGGAFAACSSPFSTGALADGGHSVTVRHTDAAGNVGSAVRAFTTDTTAPQVSISAPSDGAALSDNTPNIDFSVSESHPGSTTCAADGGGFAACTSPFTTATLSDGVHSVAVRHTDAAGNLGTRLVSFVIDTAAPAAPSITTPAGNINSSNAVPTFAGSAEANSTVTVLDGATVLGTVTANSSGGWSFTPGAALAQGAHTITARAADRAGNSGTASAPRVVTVDTTSPSAPVFTSPGGDLTTNNQTPTITGTAEVGSTVTVYDDVSPLGSTTTNGLGVWTFTPPTLNQAAHVISASTRDAAGNESPRSGTHTITVDTTSPAVAISAPAENSVTADATPDIVFSASDLHPGTTNCSVDGGTSASCTSPLTTATLTDGLHAVSVSHTDAAGNTTSVTRNFRVDTTAPSAPVFTNPPTNIVTSYTSGDLTGTAEAGSTVAIYADGFAFASVVTDGVGNWTYFTGAPAAEGSYTLSATATDPAGNTSAFSQPRSVTVDTTDPLIEVSSPSPGQIVGDSTPDVAFAVTETNPGSTECSIDGGTYGSCSSPLTTPTLTDGAHSVSIRHTDAAGNVGSDERTFTVDTAAPVVSISAPAEGVALANASPNVTFSTTDLHLSSTTCSVDGGAADSCSSPFSTDSLGDGAHAVTVTATDGAGNLSATTRNFTVDTAAPAAPSITSPSGNAYTASKKPTISGTGEAGATISVFDGVVQIGSATANGSGAWSFTSSSDFSEGAHHLTVTATDAAGNHSAASVARELTVDTIAPNAPAITTPTGDEITSDSTPTFAGTAEPNSNVTLFDGASPIGAATAGSGGAWTMTPGLALNEATHTISARATDAAGNRSAASGALTITVDQTPPNVVITSPTPGQYVNTSTPSVVFNVIEAHPVATTCAVDGGSDAACSSPFTTAPLSDGVHSVNVTHTDAAGNTATSTRTFTIDTTSPVLLISYPAEGQSINDSSPDVTFSATDESSGTAVCAFDGDTPAACTSPFGGDPLSEGAHTVTVSYTDSASNVSTTVRSFTIDLTAPAAPVILFPTSPITTSNVTGTIAGSAEPNSHLVAYENGNPLGSTIAHADGSWIGAAVSPPADGVHTIVVRATDAAGNQSAPSAPLVVTIDTVLPVVTISAPIDGAQIADNTPQIDFSLTDANPATTDCAVDSEALSTCETPFVPSTALSDGLHAVTVRHTDAAGNVGATVVSFTVDTIDPVVTITAPDENAVFSTTSLDFIFSATDQNADSTTCALDAASPTSCSSPFSVDSLDDGPHSVTVTNVDLAGNTTAAVRNIRVDTAAPAAPSIEDPAGDVTTNNVAPTLTGTAEADSSVTILDAGVSIGYSTADSAGHWIFSPGESLAEGAHSITATATDAADNDSPPSAARVITIDTNAPAAPTISTPATDATTNSPTPTIAGAAEAGSTVTIYEDSSSIGTTIADSSGDWSFVPASPLNQAEHVISARATDTAGNRSAASAARTITVDTTLPVITISSPTNGQLLSDSTPSVAFAVSDIHPGTTTCSFDGAAFTACSSPVTAGSLADGPHSASVAHTDAAGNSATATRAFSVDTLAPAQPVITSPSGDVVTSFITGTLDVTTDPNAVVTAYVGGAPFAFGVADGAGHWSFTSSDPVPEGSYTLTVTATDAAGNQSVASDPRTITMDTTDPAVTISSPDNGRVTSASTLDIAFDIADANPGHSECSVDDGAFTTCSSPFSTPELSDGGHSVVVRHFDLAENVGSSNASFVVDSQPPVVTITAPLQGSLIADSTPDIEFSVSDQNSGTTTCSIDGGSFASCSSPLNTGTLGDGPHTASVSHVDLAGNVGSAVSDFSIDASAPDAPVVTSPSGSMTTSDTRRLIQGSAEGNSVVEIFDGATSIGSTTADGSGAWSFTPASDLADGAHVVTAFATDPAGNRSASSDSREITVDTIAPASPEITTPSSDVVTGDGSPTIGGAAEANSIITISDDGNPLGHATTDGAGAWTFTPSSPLNQGDHPITATATDTAGNASASSEFRTVTVDQTSPVVVIGQPTEALAVADATPEVTFASSDAHLASTQCAIDDSVPSACSSPLTAPTLADGPHAVVISAIDQAGNTGTATRNFVVDTNPPDTQLDSVPPANDGSNDPSFAFSSADGSASFECQIDGTSWSACSSPLVFTDFADGPHTFEVRALDPAGNTDPTPSAVSWTVTTVAPPAPVITSPSSPLRTSERYPAIGGTAIADAHVTLRDGSTSIGSPTANGAGDWSFTPSSALAEGVHQITAVVIDAAGNTSPASETLEITIDLTGPTVTLTSHPGAFDSNTDAVFAFDSDEPLSVFECMIDDGGWSLCSSPQTYPGLSDGPHSVNVRATDTSDNTGAVPATLSWTVDTVAPAAAVIVEPTAGSEIALSRPPVTGSSEPYATVVVSVDGNVVGTTTADASGSWTLTPASALLDGVHIATAVVSDRAGNDGPPSAEQQFTTDTLAPTGSVVEQPGSGGNGIAPTFIIDTPSATTSVTCSIDGAAFSACASPYTPRAGLPAGTHTLVVHFSDLAGNVTSREVTFVIASATAPTQPPDSTCPTDAGADPAVPPTVRVTRVVYSGKTRLKFTVVSDQFVIVRVTVKSGAKKLGSQARALNKGQRQIVVKIKRRLAGTRLTVHLSAVSLSAGRSVVDAGLKIGTTGKLSIVQLNGQVGGNAGLGVVSCGKDAGAPAMKVSVSLAAKLKVGMRQLSLTATASQLAVSNVSVVQKGKVIARKVTVLAPGRRRTLKLRLRGSAMLAKGTARLQVTTFSVDGVRVKTTKQLRVN